MLRIVLLAGLAAAVAAPVAAAPADPAPRKGEEDCPVRQPLACGETVAASLAGGDCTDDQGRLLDVYSFAGSAGEGITVTLDPSGFEGDLELSDPNFDEVAEVEGGVVGAPVVLTTTLGRTGTWFLVVKADDAGTSGPYTLTLQCGGATEPPPPPPPAGFFLDPAYPDFQFRVRIGPAGAPLAGRREADCQPETVCVSGALRGRSEVFMRLLGPRGNGFLWPTIIRFTPSRVAVDIRQISTGITRTYVLDAVPPGTDDLSGLQDRTGFRP